MDIKDTDSVHLIRRMQHIKAAAKDLIQDKDYMRTKLLLEAKSTQEDLIHVLDEALDMPMIKDNLLGFGQTNGYTFLRENRDGDTSQRAVPAEEYRVLTNEYIRGDNGITWFISVNMTTQRVQDIFFDTGVSPETRYISVVTGFIYEMIASADEAEQEAWFGELAMKNISPVDDKESAKWAVDDADILNQIVSDFKEVAHLVYENLYEQLRMLEQLVALQLKLQEESTEETGTGAKMLDHSVELAEMTAQTTQKG